MELKGKLVDMQELEIAISIGICLLLAKFVPFFQAMTACIAVLLCVQDNVARSWKTGLTRLIITAIGGVTGILVILLDQWLGNSWLLIILVMPGILLTLLGCRMAKVPAISARIGGITFILVVLTQTGIQRVNYAVFRFLSTLIGVIVVAAVTALCGVFAKGKTENGV